MREFLILYFDLKYNVISLGGGKAIKWRKSYCFIFRQGEYDLLQPLLLFSAYEAS